MNPNAQERRGDYHEDVPLFFIDNPPMLHTVIYNQNNTDITLLEISPEATNCTGVKFSYGNVAENAKNIYNDPDDLKKLDWDWDVIISPNYQDHQFMSDPEMLIPERVDSQYIDGIYYRPKLRPEKEEELQSLVDNPERATKIFIEGSLKGASATGAGEQIRSY